MIAEVTVHDYAATIEFLNRAVTHIEEHVAGVLAWDCFVDETNGRMVMYEEFTDEEALLAYEKSMTEHGYRQGLGEIANLDRVTVLGSVSDPGLVAALGQMGAVVVDHTVGVNR